MSESTSLAPIAWIKDNWPKVRSFLARMFDFNDLESKANAIDRLLERVTNSEATIKIDFDGLHVDARTVDGERRVVVRDRPRPAGSPAVELPPTEPPLELPPP